MRMSLENIQPLVRCPVCNKKYRPEKMLVLDEDEKRTTLHLTCDECSASSVVLVSMGQFGVISFGVLTDLEQSEAQRAFQSESISSDQVIAVHRFLKNHEGGVEPLI